MEHIIPSRSDVLVDSPEICRRLSGRTDCTASVDELDHPGFAFGTNQVEFDTLNSKILKGIVKMIPHEFRRKVDLLDGK